MCFSYDSSSDSDFTRDVESHITATTRKSFTHSHIDYIVIITDKLLIPLPLPSFPASLGRGVRGMTFEEGAHDPLEQFDIIDSTLLEITHIDHERRRLSHDLDPSLPFLLPSISSPLLPLSSSPHHHPSTTFTSPLSPTLSSIAALESNSRKERLARRLQFGEKDERQVAVRAISGQNIQDASRSPRAMDLQRRNSPLQPAMPSPKLLQSPPSPHISSSPPSPLPPPITHVLPQSTTLPFHSLPPPCPSPPSPSPTPPSSNVRSVSRTVAPPPSRPPLQSQQPRPSIPSSSKPLAPSPPVLSVDSPALLEILSFTPLSPISPSLPPLPLPPAPAALPLPRAILSLPPASRKQQPVEPPITANSRKLLSFGTTIDNGGIVVPEVCIFTPLSPISPSLPSVPPAAEVPPRIDLPPVSYSTRRSVAARASRTHTTQPKTLEPSPSLLLPTECLFAPLTPIYPSLPSLLADEQRNEHVVKIPPHSPTTTSLAAFDPPPSSPPKPLAQSPPPSSHSPIHDTITATSPTTNNHSAPTPTIIPFPYPPTIVMASCHPSRYAAVTWVSRTPPDCNATSVIDNPIPAPNSSKKRKLPAPAAATGKKKRGNAKNPVVVDAVVEECTEKIRGVCVECAWRANVEFHGPIQPVNAIASKSHTHLSPLCRFPKFHVDFLPGLVEVVKASPHISELGDLLNMILATFNPSLLASTPLCPSSPHLVNNMSSLPSLDQKECSLKLCVCRYFQEDHSTVRGRERNWVGLIVCFQNEKECSQRVLMMWEVAVQCVLSSRLQEW